MVLLMMFLLRLPMCHWHVVSRHWRDAWHIPVKQSTEFKFTVLGSQRSGAIKLESDVYCKKNANSSWDDFRIVAFLVAVVFKQIILVKVNVH